MRFQSSRMHSISSWEYSEVGVYILTSKRDQPDHSKYNRTVDLYNFHCRGFIQFSLFLTNGTWVHFHIMMSTFFPTSSHKVSLSLSLFDLISSKLHPSGKPQQRESRSTQGTLGCFLARWIVLFMRFTPSSNLFPPVALRSPKTWSKPEDKPTLWRVIHF